MWYTKWKIGITTSLIGILSCTNHNLDKNTLAIVPAENIQVSFDLITDSDLTYKSFVNSKGNYFEITNLSKLSEYVKSNKNQLLLSNNFAFLWDTLQVSKKLYLIDLNKAHHLTVKSIKQAEENTKTTQHELFLTPKSKSNLSVFFATQIGKGLVLIDKNGFVTSAEKISRLDNGNLGIAQ